MTTDQLTTTDLTFGPVDAEPYPWPYDGSFSPSTTAIINIDWQQGTSAVPAATWTRWATT